MSKFKPKLLSEFRYPWLKEQLEHWGVGFTDEESNSVIVNSEAEISKFDDSNEKELLSFENVKDINLFLKAGGRLIVDPKYLSSKVGHFILKRKILGLFSTNLDDVYPSIIEQKSYKIDSHIRSGYYSDLVAIDCFEKGYDLYKVRKVINNFVYYLEYLNQSKICSRPMDITVAYTDDTCIIQIVASEFKYYLDHIIQANQGDQLHNIDSLISDLLPNISHLEIFRLELAGKLGLVAYIPKEFTDFNYTGITLASIERAPYIRESDKSVANIVNGYIQNLEEKEAYLQKNKLPGNGFSMVEINSKGEKLKEDPGRILGLAKHLKEKFKDRLVGINNYHELSDDEMYEMAAGYSDRDLLSNLSTNDLFDLKEVLGNEILLSNFDILTENEKVVVKDNLPEEMLEVMRVQAQKHEDLENIVVKGVTENIEKDEAIIVKGVTEDLEGGLIKVKGGNTKEVYGEILHVLSSEDLSNEEDLKKALATKVAKKLNINEAAIEDFIEENIGEFESQQSIYKANQKIKDFSKFDKGVISSKEIEISTLKHQIRGLENVVDSNKQIQKIFNETEIEDDLISSEAPIAGAGMIEGLNTDTSLTAEEVENIKQLLVTANELKSENSLLTKQLRKTELANSSLQNHFNSEVRKANYAQEKRHVLLLKTKDLLGKQLESKDQLLRAEVRKNEALSKQIEALNSEEFETSKTDELERKVRQLELELEHTKENNESANTKKADDYEKKIRHLELELEKANSSEASTENIDLSSFVEIKNKLERELKAKDEQIAFLEKSARNTGSSGSASGGSGGNILLEQELFEAKKKIEKLEKSAKGVGAGPAKAGAMNPAKIREMEHKLKLLQSVNKTQEKEIASLKKLKAKLGGSAAEGKGSKLQEKQIEKLKEEAAKNVSVLKKHKMEISKFKSENTALKNELNTLKSKLKRAS